MQTFNIQFKNKKTLIEFIQNNNLSQNDHILIQVFSGVIDESKSLEVSKILKNNIPNANIIGVSTAGEILNSSIYEGTILITFTIFTSTIVKSKLYDFNKPFEIEDIMKSLILDNTKAIIIFSDGLKSNAELLLKNISSIKPNIIIAGGRAADPINFNTTFVFDHNISTQKGCVIASLSGDNLIVNNDYILNWNKIGKEMIITNAKNSIVYSIDNIPIKKLYKKYLGAEVTDNLPSSGTEFPLITTRNGINIARSTVAVLEDDSFLFAGNLSTGEKVRFAYGNLNEMHNAIDSDYIKFSKLPIESIFAYSCSGRKSLMGEELESEFKMLSSLAPTSGFFTFGEYFHSSSISELLNITTTFLALSESKITPKKNIYTTKKYDNNRILKVLTNLTNVTTQELEYQNIELSRLNNMISNSVFYSTSDLKGNITTISNAYLNFLEIKEKDILGKNHNIFRHPDTPKEFYKNMWDLLNKNKKCICEIRNINNKGDEYWLKMNITPTYDENKRKIGYSAYYENITDRKKLEYISTHDPLTKLYNRGAFTNEINKKIKSAKRYNEELGFIIFDIDHFKLVNDTYGHKIGDDVLIKLSNCISKNLRENDFLARWGGEEFVIIAYHTNIKQLVNIVKKIQIEISKINFTPVPKVTLSFGLTVFKNNDTKDSILNRADEALYKSKKNGRDRYSII
jgi:diguanylate cyclase (GGDEF)-like protein/PAS domain S-box-containing protein